MIHRREKITKEETYARNQTYWIEHTLLGDKVYFFKEIRPFEFRVVEVFDIVEAEDEMPTF